MESENQRLLTWAYFGALQGAVAWTAYAIIECWLVTIMPFIFKGHSSPDLYHWGFTLILFFTYALAGMILGGILGLVSHALLKKSQFLSRLDFFPLLSVLISFAVAISFFINFIIQTKLTLSAIGLVALILMIVMALALNVRSRLWREKLGFLTKPVMVSAMLLGESWILLDLLKDNRSRLIKASAASLYLIGFILCSLVLHRYFKKLAWPRTKVSGPKSFRSDIVFLTTVLFISLAVSARVNRPNAPIRSSPDTPPPQAPLPNIILIVMDTVRADHLSLYGYERDTTPNLRNFAEEATLYLHAIASSNTTLSTHASIFTGLYPRQHGAYMKPPEYPYGVPLSANFDTIAEILSREGYSTMAVTSNYQYVNPESGLAQGFQYFDFRKPIRFLMRGPAFYLRAAVYEIFREISPRYAFDKVYKNAEEINTQVFGLLDKSIKIRRPFFLFVNYMDAHNPYLPPHPFDLLYPGKDHSFTYKDYEGLWIDIMKQKRTITISEHGQLISQYDGAIAYLDYNIGQLIERLKELEIYKKSLIIVTSDHGEAFGEKSLLGHGVSVYQNQIHVPLIIKYPEIAVNRRLNQLVSSIDIMPTILNILDRKQPDMVHGCSLENITQLPDRVIMSAHYSNERILQLHPRFARVERALFSGKLKLIKSTGGKLELYDCWEDPNEEIDIIRKSSKSRELQERLDKWLEEFEELPSPPLNKKMLEQLKSLGYINQDN
jgi:arylsulfatase A-like enzyme